MKDAYYFPHDANAHNDPNIIKLLYKHCWAGYGLYWSIIEKLRNEPDYTMETDYDMIAYALRVEADEIKSISKLPLEEQESILESMSKSFHPIEIDGTTFMIPEQVNDLIDNLLSQIQEKNLALDIVRPSEV